MNEQERMGWAFVQREITILDKIYCVSIITSQILVRKALLENYLLLLQVKLGSSVSYIVHPQNTMTSPLLLYSD
jgi:hypothetical protein